MYGVTVALKDSFVLGLEGNYFFILLKTPSFNNREYKVKFECDEFFMIVLDVALLI